jgi:zinc protease
MMIDRLTQKRRFLRMRALCLLPLALLPGGIASAQTKGAQTSGTATTVGLPPLAPARPLNLPEIVQKELPNGLKIVLLEDHRQPAVWLRLTLPAGSIRDPNSKVGLANMTASLLDKGTTSRTEAQIADTVDGLGAALGAGAGDDTFTISTHGLSSQVDSLFELMADITLRPTFPQAELDRARTRLLSGITASLSEPGTLADLALARRIYGAHPYGNYSAGTPETVPTITRQDIVRFHDTYFAPNVATLFLAGDITPDRAVQKAQTLFGSWGRKEVPALPAPPKASAATGDKPQIILIDRPGSAQTEVRIGLLTSGYNTPERAIGTVATTVLGLGNFEGRLTKEIRVKRGLTYGASSYFGRNAQAGMFEITTFTKNASTGEVLKIALEEARKLQSEAVPAEELQERKDYLNGSFAVSVATPSGILNRLFYSVLYGAGPGELTTYVQRVQAVTPDQIEQIMKGLDLARPQIVLVGDARAIEDQVRSLGDITKISADAVDLLSPSLQAKETGNGPQPANQGSTEEVTEGKARLAATVKAHGGDAFLNVKQLEMKGSGEFSPPGQQIKLKAKTAVLTVVRPGKARLEMNTDFGDIILAVPGAGMAGWVSALGNVQDLPPGGGFIASDPTELLRSAMQDNRVVRALPAKENGKAVTAPDGKALRGFSITDNKGQVSSVYVDAGTSLIRRIVVKGKQGNLIFLLSDYHNADGVQLPGSLQILGGETPIANMTFSSFQVNKPVDDALFARPK